MSADSVTPEGQSDPVFTVGETVVCQCPDDYAFTTGKEYVVIGVGSMHADPHFTWHAYLHVVDDTGRRVACHAHRFTRKE